MTQSFGDTSAACGLEVAIVKFICSIALLDITKWILEYSRYADNILHSTESVEEYKEIKKDLINSFSAYSMPLK